MKIEKLKLKLKELIDVVVGGQRKVTKPLNVFIFFGLMMMWVIGFLNSDIGN